MTMAYAGNTADEELAAQVAETHVFNLPITLVLETIKCHNLGSLDCIYGVCTAEGTYDSQNVPGKLLFSITATNDETCDNTRFYVSEIMSLDL